MADFDVQPSAASSMEENSPNGTLDMSCLKNNATFPVSETLLMRIPPPVNMTFVAIYLLLLGVAIIANCLTIYVTYKGKHRLLYRCCLISLACSDLMIAISAGLSNFPKYLQEYFTFWVMGEFLCYFLPFLQTASVLANSMTLSCIAVDRYLMVTQSMRTYWDPSGFACVAGVLAIWVTSAGVASPMYGLYLWVTAATLGEHGHPCILFNMCVLATKDMKNAYFIAVFAIIFLPLLCTFIVLYCLMMWFLWTRKRPGASKPFIAAGDTKGTISSRAGARDSRKTRTVKAIFALMVTFIVLRMPSWVFLLYSSEPSRILSGLGWWLAQNGCSALMLLNSTINPFFYCFLGQVMSVWDSLVAKFCRTSGAPKHQPSETPAQPAAEEKRQPPSQVPQLMVPRGPYSTRELSGDANLKHRADGKNCSCTTLSSLNSSPRLDAKDTNCPSQGGLHSPQSLNVLETSSSENLQPSATSIKNGSCTYTSSLISSPRLHAKDMDHPRKGCASTLGS